MKFGGHRGYGLRPCLKTSCFAFALRCIRVVAQSFIANNTQTMYLTNAVLNFVRLHSSPLHDAPKNN